MPTYEVVSGENPDLWPDPIGGHRIILPPHAVAAFREDAATSDLHPIASGFVPLPPDHNYHLGRQEWTAIYYCTAGRGVVRRNDEIINVVAGDVFAVPRGDTKDLGSDPDSPWTFHWVRLEGTLEQLYTPILAESRKLHVGVNARLISDFEEQLQLLRMDNSFLNRVAVAGRLKALIAQIALLDEVRHPVLIGPIDEDRIRSLLLDNLNAQLSLEEIAAIAGVSKFYFARLFKEKTGVPPLRYFMHLKMRRACELLDTSSLSVQQIAAEVGFDDPQHFSRKFRTVVGMPPSDYRLLSRS